MRSRTLHRRLSIAIGFACTASALAVATIGAPAGAGSNSGHGGDDDRRHGNDAPVLLFVADGLRQDLVEQFAANRRRGRSDMPAMAELLKKGYVRLRWWPAHPGAAEHRCRLVQPRHRRLAGRPRVDQQHVPHQRRAVCQQHQRLLDHACHRPSRSDSRPNEAARRSCSSSTPAARRRRSRARRSTSAGSFPVAAWPRTTSHPPTTPNFVAAFGLQFDHPTGFAGPGPVPRCGAGRGHRLDRTPHGRSAPRWRCGCASSTSASTSTASTPISSTAPTIVG